MNQKYEFKLLIINIDYYLLIIISELYSFQIMFEKSKKCYR